FVGYIGAAVGVAVLGAMLPFERLRGKDGWRIAAGVATLFLLSFVPFLGTGLVVVLLVAGVGALLLTRAGGRPLQPVSE
ncbi:MAG: hypothetical protein AAGE52_42895, partial [Myxococcota bacterium]